MATREKYGGDNDVKKRLSANGYKEKSSGKIVVLFGEFVVHNGALLEYDGLQGDDLHADFGNYHQEEIHEKLNNCMAKASQNGLSGAGVRQVRDSIEKKQNNIQANAWKWRTCKSPPMKFQLDPNKKPVRVKARKYAVFQRRFHDKYISQILKMGLIKPCPQASCQAALHLLPNDCNSLI